MKTRNLKAGDDRLVKSCADSQIKAADGDGDAGGGTVTGYASTFDREPDCYGDVVAPGAFAGTLERWKALNGQGKFIPLLYGHNSTDPEYNIGRVVDAGEDERGLWVKAEFDQENAKAQYVRRLVKEGRVYQFSFAYDVIEAGETTLENGVKANELRKLDLFEVSIVQIPANQHATVEEVKAASDMGMIRADLIKAGRRNSKSDEDQLKRIAELASEIQEIVSGLLADSDSGSADGADDGESPKGGAEGRDSQAELLATYKQAFLATIKED